ALEQMVFQRVHPRFARRHGLQRAVGVRRLPDLEGDQRRCDEVALGPRYGLRHTREAPMGAVERVMDVRLLARDEVDQRLALTRTLRAARVDERELALERLPRWRRIVGKAGSGCEIGRSGSPTR